MNATDLCYRFQGRTPPQVGQRQFAAVKADEGDGVATIRLYDPIDSWGGEWGVSAKEFADALDELGDDVGEIRLHINSPGGEVFEGIAILNALRNHDAKVTTVVDGLAASAASFIAMAGDEVIMGRNAELMIHDAWGICIGNAEDMRDLAGRLDHLSDNIASVYAEKAGGGVAAWREHMLTETWYSAEEAVEAGLADRVQTAKSTKTKNTFDLSVFNYGGRAEAPAPTPVSDPGTSESADNAADEAAAQAAAVSAAESADAQMRARFGVTENAARIAFGG